MEHFLSPNSCGDLRSDPHQSQIIGGDADKDHTQIIGGTYPPWVLAPLLKLPLAPQIIPFAIKYSLFMQLVKSCFCTATFYSTA